MSNTSEKQVGKWYFKNWCFPFHTTWWWWSWWLCGSVVGGGWGIDDSETKRVDSLCILGFCFEKILGDVGPCTKK